MIKLKNSLLLFIFSATLVYLIIFGRAIFNDSFFYSGDMKEKFYPTRIYLYNQIVHEKQFPFWSEKIFMGFPLYADPENGYLNIINVLAMLAFGPITSIKVLHYTSYLAGSIGLFFLLKALYPKASLLACIAANTTYFMSFLFINHQIHLNIILTLYLFPINILLQYLMLKTDNNQQLKKYKILQGLLLAYYFYWGHFQSIFLILLVMISFTASQLPIHNINIIKKQIFNILQSLILCILFSLPQLLPTSLLYVNSFRYQNAHELYTESEFVPSMIYQTLYPFLLGDADNFIGNNIKTAYNFTDISIYVGIVAIGVALFLLFTNICSRKIKSLFIINFIIFLVLAFSSFLPPDINNLLIFTEFFRRWMRSIFIVSFSIALLLPVLENIDKKKLRLTKSYLLIFFGAILYLIFLDIFNFNAIQNFKLLKEINLGDLIKTGYFHIWSSLFIFTIVSLAGISLLKNNEEPTTLRSGYLISHTRDKIRSILVNLIYVSILVDTIFFGYITLKNDPAENNFSTAYTTNTTPIRLIQHESSITGNNNLLGETYGYEGSSQFVDYDYIKTLNSLGLTQTTIGRVEIYDTCEHLLGSNIYQELNINKCIENTGEVVFENNNNIISDNRVKIINSSENYYKLENIADETIKLTTKIKYNPNWLILKSGKISLPFKKDIFLGVENLKPRETMNLVYIPVDFLIGFLILLLSTPLIILWYSRNIEDINWRT